MRQNTFPLRLASSLQEEARKTAESEGISLNQLINLAVAEKISVLRTEEFFRERSGRANINRARKALKRAGKEKPKKAMRFEPEQEEAAKLSAGGTIRR